MLRDSSGRASKKDILGLGIPDRTKTPTDALPRKQRGLFFALMQVAEDLIRQHSKGFAKKAMLFVIRLKLDNKRGFVKDYRLSTLSKKYKTSKSATSRYLKYLKKEKLIWISDSGCLHLASLNRKENGKKKRTSTVRVSANMSDTQIMKQLYSKVVRNKLNNMKFLVNLKSDHENLRDRDIFPKHFNTEKALIKAERKYVLETGISREVNQELTISDKRFATLFGVSRRFYNQKIKPLMRSRCGITIKVVLEEVPVHAYTSRYCNIQPLFVSFGKTFRMKTIYNVRQTETPKRTQPYKLNHRK